MSSAPHIDDPAGISPYVFDHERLRAVEDSGLLAGGPTPEPELDRYTRLAARLTGAPIARLSIVDARGQHFKSAVGPLPASGRSTALGNAICRHVVGQGAPLVIADAATDPLVARNGAVRQDGTGAYLGVPVRWPDGHVLGSFCVADTRPRRWTDEDLAALEDLAAAVNTELALRAALADARRRADRDALTGLPSRSLLLAELEAASRRLPHDRPLGVILLDLDGFKVVNDSLGHDAGDELLCVIADRLRAHARSEDIVGRLSGDEFVVLSPRIRGIEDLGALAERLLAACRQAIEIEGRQLFLDACAGVAVARTNTEAADVLRRADLAMYEAKRSGRGRIQGFEHALSDRISTRMALEGQLRGAHERGEMRLVYQPVVELTTRRIVAVEALLRWTHPDLGNVTPLEFIELAERTGAIVELGAWALNRAVAQAAAWAANGLALDVAVNVSARQLGDPAFPAFVADCLERHGLPAERLSLELTESIVMERRGDAADRLEELTATGLRLAIDDFGTGYSSLQRLRALPVNTLKVDRSFVDGLHTDPHDEAIVTATLSMARTMGLDVVAEGVENDAQAGKLLDLGCGLAQGFLFSRPLEPVQVAPLLTARRRAVRA